MSKKSDYRQSCVERKDIRGGKDGYEQSVKPHKRKKKKRPIIVEYRYTGEQEMIFCKREWELWKRFAKRADAQKCIDSRAGKMFWGEFFEYRIKDDT